MKVDFTPLRPSAPSSSDDAPVSAQPSLDEDLVARTVPEAPVESDAPGTSKKRGGLFSRAPKAEKPAKGSKKAKGSDPKATDKSMSASQLKRERDKRKRSMRMGVRYGGDRGKWLAAWAVLGSLALCGPIAIAIAASKPSASEVDERVLQTSQQMGKDFPQGQAAMWAGQVVRIWGTWDETAPDSRKVAMSPFLSAGMDAQGGWNGKGKQEVSFVSVNPVPNVTDANHASVDATYQIQDGIWRCIRIPVYAFQPSDFTAKSQWAFALASNPTPVACTPRTGAPNLSNTDAASLNYGGKQADSQLGQELSASFFPGFFAAYASSETAALTQYTASGVTVTGLGGAMTSIPQPIINNAVVYVDSKGISTGKVYQAYVPVTWTLANSASQVTAAYMVPIKKEGDRWYVAGEPTSSVQAAEAQGGAPAQIPMPGDGVNPGPYPTVAVTTVAPKPTVAPKVTTTAPAAKPAPVASKK